MIQSALISLVKGMTLPPHLQISQRVRGLGFTILYASLFICSEIFFPSLGK